MAADDYFDFGWYSVFIDDRVIEDWNRKETEEYLFKNNNSDIDWLKKFMIQDNTCFKK